MQGCATGEAEAEALVTDGVAGAEIAGVGDVVTSLARQPLRPATRPRSGRRGSVHARLRGN